MLKHVLAKQLQESESQITQYQLRQLDFNTCQPQRV